MTKRRYLQRHLAHARNVSNLSNLRYLSNLYPQSLGPSYQSLIPKRQKKEATKVTSLTNLAIQLFQFQNRVEVGQFGIVHVAPIGDG